MKLKLTCPEKSILQLTALLGDEAWLQPLRPATMTMTSPQPTLPPSLPSPSPSTGTPSSSLLLMIPQNENILCIINGGETGTEQAALAVAHELGLTTAGLAAPCFRTEEGFNLTLRDKYGLSAATGKSEPEPEASRLSRLCDNANVAQVSIIVMPRAVHLLTKLVDFCKRGPPPLIPAKRAGARKPPPSSLRKPNRRISLKKPTTSRYRSTTSKTTSTSKTQAPVTLHRPYFLISTLDHTTGSKIVRFLTRYNARLIHITGLSQMEAQTLYPNFETTLHTCLKSAFQSYVTAWSQTHRR